MLCFACFWVAGSLARFLLGHNAKLAPKAVPEGVLGFVHRNMCVLCQHCTVMEQHTSAPGFALERLCVGVCDAIRCVLCCASPCCAAQVIALVQRCLSEPIDASIRSIAQHMLQRWKWQLAGHMQVRQVAGSLLMGGVAVRPARHAHLSPVVYIGVVIHSFIGGKLTGLAHLAWHATVVSSMQLQIYRQLGSRTWTANFHWPALLLCPLCVMAQVVAKLAALLDHL
jgi:hypothetical protein